MAAEPPIIAGTIGTEGVTSTLTPDPAESPPNVAVESAPLLAMARKARRGHVAQKELRLITYRKVGI